MKHTTCWLIFVLSITALARDARTIHGMDPTPADRTKVRFALVNTGTTPLAASCRFLLDDQSLLPGARNGNNNDVGRAGEFLKRDIIRFQENRGQIIDSEGRVRPDILFVADAPGARLFFRNGGISYVFTKKDERAGDPPESDWLPSSQQEFLDEDETSETRSPSVGREDFPERYRLDMTLLGCNPGVRVRCEGELPGYVNYYRPLCPEGITGIREYSRIVYENVYNNIDLELFSTRGRMKYNFVVRPGGEAESIRMQYHGTIAAEVMRDGALSVATPLGGIEEAAPYTYAEDKSHEIPSRFIRNDNTVSFAVEAYDRSKILVIDPWATYYGGSGSDCATGVATDANGNVYVSGWTNSADFPVSAGAIQTSLAGSYDAFVVKFDASGNRLWATYYGGSGDENLNVRVACDDAGNVIFTGRTTSTNFPVSSGAFQKRYGGGTEDAFVVKLTGSGVRLWATYCGGRSSDRSYGVAADSGNNVLIAGSTTSNNFPVSSGAFQTAIAKGEDSFVMKFDPNGGRVWATYYGGKDNDAAFGGVATDGSNVIFVGNTRSTNFPVTAGAFQTSYTGGVIYGDAFIVTFNSGGGRLWATYYGGSYDDHPRGVTIDVSGNVIFAGSTQSLDFPISTGAFQSSLSGSSDAYVVKFNLNGTRQWATYYGGGSSEFCLGVAADGNENIVLSGATGSVDFPVSAGALQSSHAGGNHDAFTVKLTTSGARQWATYYGGSGDEQYSWGAVATDSQSNIFFVGGTVSQDFPLSNPYQKSVAGGSDGFIVSLNGGGLFLKQGIINTYTPGLVVLFENYPNPLQSMTSVSFTLSEEMTIRMSVHDVLGREVAVLADGSLTPGTHSRMWTPDVKLPSGNYIIRLIATQHNNGKGRVLHRRMILAK